MFLGSGKSYTMMGTNDQKGTLLCIGCSVHDTGQWSQVGVSVMGHDDEVGVSITPQDEEYEQDASEEEE